MGKIKVLIHISSSVNHERKTEISYQVVLLAVVFPEIVRYLQIGGDTSHRGIEPYLRGKHGDTNIVKN